MPPRASALRRTISCTSVKTSVADMAGLQLDEHLLMPMLPLLQALELEVGPLQQAKQSLVVTALCMIGYFIVRVKKQWHTIYLI